MKRCPRCNSVYDDSLVYCTNDGSPLVEESFVLPSEASEETEEETVVRHDPIRIDVAAPTEAPAVEIHHRAAPTVPAATIIVEKPARNTGQYALFLLIGLLLGGGLVLATLLAMRYLSADRTTETSVNVNRAARATPAPSVKESPEDAAPKASAAHQRPTEASDDEFNGRVIALNAYMRFLPSREAAAVDVLPAGDRLDISSRADENSPWFYAVCEHGTAGWMHGNTIEYTR